MNVCFEPPNIPAAKPHLSGPNVYMIQPRVMNSVTESMNMLRTNPGLLQWTREQSRNCHVFLYSANQHSYFLTQSKNGVFGPAEVCQGVTAEPQTLLPRTNDLKTIAMLDWLEKHASFPGYPTVSAWGISPRHDITGYLRLSPHRDLVAMISPPLKYMSRMFGKSAGLSQEEMYNRMSWLGFARDDITVDQHHKGSYVSYILNVSGQDRVHEILMRESLFGLVAESVRARRGDPVSQTSAVGKWAMHPLFDSQLLGTLGMFLLE